MNQTIPVSVDQLQRIEHRLKTLELTVRALVRIVQGVEKQDSFAALFHSKAFEAHKKEMLDRFKSDPSQFVDPFATYQTK
jgi:hypothetical protein